MNKVSRVLGWAFLFQAVTSLTSGVVLKAKWHVDGDISATMSNIAAHPGWLRANILLDMMTAMGVIFLGAMLFLSLRKINEKMALTGMAFYILEGALIAASQMNVFSLLGLSQEWAAAGQPAALLAQGNMLYNASFFTGMNLSMLAFSLGALPLYYLLVKSNILPRVISILGLVTVIPCLVGTVLEIFGNSVPFAVYAPYVPFEFVFGIWIIVRGVKANVAREVTTAAAQALSEAR